MFKKTITRLAYSPTLAEELTDYARRLRHEESKRKIGLIFIVLALVVQSFAVLQPPESANAGRTSDFIEGGVSTVDDYLRHYDQNTHNIKDLLSSLGISRSDIQSTRAAKVEQATDTLVWKMTSQGSAIDTPYSFLKVDGTQKTVYYRPLIHDDVFSRKISSSQSATALIGSSPSAGWFGLLKNSGNLVTRFPILDDCPSENDSSKNTPATVALSDIDRCNLKLATAISAHNLTTDTPANSRSAQSSDRIIYTLTVTNNDSRNLIVPLRIGLGDLVEYSELIDKGGGSFTQESNTLTWTAATITPGTSVTRSFILRLAPFIPSTAQGINNSSSYDCTMSSSFGKNTLHVPVACPLPKSIEQITKRLPLTPIKDNVIFSAAIVTVAAYFYARSRQTRTELRLIRHNYHGSL